MLSSKSFSLDSERKTTTVFFKTECSFKFISPNIYNLIWGYFLKFNFKNLYWNACCMFFMYIERFLLINKDIILSLYHFLKSCYPRLSQTLSYMNRKKILAIRGSISMLLMVFFMELEYSPIRTCGCRFIINHVWCRRLCRSILGPANLLTNPDNLKQSRDLKKCTSHTRTLNTC